MWKLTSLLQLLDLNSVSGDDLGEEAVLVNHKSGFKFEDALLASFESLL